MTKEHCRSPHSKRVNGRSNTAETSKARTSSPLTTTILRLHRVCPLHAHVSHELAALAQASDNAALARLATDAYQLALAAHALLERTAAFEESGAVG